jgi:hypothetical protein
MTTYKIETACVCRTTGNAPQAGARNRRGSKCGGILSLLSFDGGDLFHSQFNCREAACFVVTGKFCGMIADTVNNPAGVA